MFSSLWRLFLITANLAPSERCIQKLAPRGAEGCRTLAFSQIDKKGSTLLHVLGLDYLGQQRAEPLCVLLPSRWHNTVAVSDCELKSRSATVPRLAADPRRRAPPSQVRLHRRGASH